MARCIICGGAEELVQCGPKQAVCHTCITALNRCWHAKREGDARHLPHEKAADIPTPQTLVEQLNQKVIGQKAAKQAVAIATWKHLQRVHGNVAAPKANVLLYGPTGCGKTYLAQTVAAMMDVPFVAIDATTITETGYRGRDAKDILTDILAVAGDTPKARQAVVYLDEFDKLAAHGNADRQAYQRGTQHALLTLIEGANITVEWKRSNVSFETKNLLFIVGGAFSALHEILAARLCKENRRTIGFGADLSKPPQPDITDLLPQAIPDDFVAYGLEPELVGRIPVLAPILPLSVDDLVQILMAAEGSVVSQYTAFFTHLGVDFSISQDAAEELARMAYNAHTGARGLRGRLEKIIADMLFDMPGDGIHITKEIVLGVGKRDEYRDRRGSA